MCAMAAGSLPEANLAASQAPFGDKNALTLTEALGDTLRPDK